MGFNLSGIVLNRSYKDNINAINNQFNWNLEFEKEIDFETASENWKDEGICDIYFAEKGTLLFINMDMCVEAWHIENGNSLTFALSETSMAFNLNYCEGQNVKRSIMEVNGERMTDEGDKLQAENSAEDTSEIIWQQMGEVLGKTFWSIEPDEKAYRYKFIKNEQAVEKPLSLDTESPLPTAEEMELMFQAYFKERIEKVNEILSFVEANKGIKNRQGKMGYLCKTNVEFSEENINSLNSHPSILKIERITNATFGPGYITTFKTLKTSLIESIKNIFTKK